MRDQTSLNRNITSASLYLFDRPYYAIKCQCCLHIETSQLICFANRLAGFYMRATLALNGLIRSLVEFYLFLIRATLFLLIGLFIIL